MGHSGKEGWHIFFSMSLCRRTKRQPLSFSPSKPAPCSPLSAWSSSSKRATCEAEVCLREATLLHICFSWVFLVTLASVFPFALSLVRNPSRFHRPIRPEVTDHTEPTETGKLTSWVRFKTQKPVSFCTSPAGKALSQRSQCGSSRRRG